MPETSGTQIGLLGGTFDPPHRAHLALALGALAAARLDQVWLVPACVPPHKAAAGISAPEHRLAMAERLAAEDERLAVCDEELRRGGTSYTIDTVRALAARHPTYGWGLILGADMVLEIGTWKEANRLLRQASPLVADRPGSPLPQDLGHTPPPGIDQQGGAKLQAGRFHLAPLAIASSRIRAAVGRGEDVSAWVTPAVLAYIMDKGLYRTGTGP